MDRNRLDCRDCRRHRRILAEPGRPSAAGGVCVGPKTNRHPVPQSSVDGRDSSRRSRTLLGYREARRPAHRGPSGGPDAGVLLGDGARRDRAWFPDRGADRAAGRGDAGAAGGAARGRRRRRRCDPARRREPPGWRAVHRAVGAGQSIQGGGRRHLAPGHRVRHDLRHCGGDAAGREARAAHEHRRRGRCSVDSHRALGVAVRPHRHLRARRADRHAVRLEPGAGDGLVHGGGHRRHTRVHRSRLSAVRLDSGRARAAAVPASRVSFHADGLLDDDVPGSPTDDDRRGRQGSSPPAPSLRIRPAAGRNDQPWWQRAVSGGRRPVHRAVVRHSLRHRADVPGRRGGVSGLTHGRGGPVGQRPQPLPGIPVDRFANRRHKHSPRPRSHTRHVSYDDKRHRPSERRRRRVGDRRSGVSLATLLIASPWIAVLFVVVHRFAARTPRLRDYEPSTSGPLVSVIIPARNEARNVERCVRSLLATTYSPIQVIVVDDRSTDGTASIVAQAAGTSVLLVRGVEPPVGWFGKQWAIMQGYRVAKGDLLLFADADTRHEPELLPRAVRGLHDERVDLFTVLPRQEMLTFWERLIQPHVFVALESRFAYLASVNRTRTYWNAIANGQFILTTRAAYEAVGTHEAVKHSVADDVMLAQNYVRAGKDIFIAQAREFMTTRMYGSLHEILAGWTKNLALGAPLMMPPIPAVRALLPYVMWTPALAWIAPPLVWLIAGGGWGFAAIATLVSLLTWIIIYAVESAPVWYALLYPLGAGVVAFIMLRSAVRGRRLVEWRGRSYRA